MSDRLLTVEGLAAAYGESVVLEGLSFEVRRNEVVSLLGPNGAGKTTTLSAITGLIPSSGRVQLAGTDIDGLPAHKRVDFGMALSPEGRQVFPLLSVEDNLLLGSFAPRGRRNRARNLSRVYDLFGRLAERKRQLAGLMSGGEQQMLAIGRAMMSEPQLLLLDEPSLGLAPLITGQVYEAITGIAREGVSILLVEQNTEAALSISDRAYVLSHGEIVTSGSSQDLRDAPILRDAFLGGAAAAGAAR